MLPELVIILLAILLLCAVWREPLAVGGPTLVLGQTAYLNGGFLPDSIWADHEDRGYD